MNRLILLALICSLSLSSCNRKIGAVFSKKEELIIVNPEFKFLTSKAKFKFDNDGKKVSATANFRISKDSIIWISISGFGIEAARILIDTEIVRVLDRLNKQYYEYTFEELSQEYNFDFNFRMIQSVLLGNLIEPYKNQKYKEIENHYIYNDSQGDYYFQNFIGSISRKLEKVNVLDKITNNSISVNYSDFIQVRSQIFPNEITAVIDYATADKPNTKINISYSRMEIASSPLKFPYSVSSKYERK